jgi:putative ABC transport system ATP-binding protein
MSTLVLKQVFKERGRGPHALQVLKGVDLCVEPGELVILEGPSGAGKTTLLSVAAGLLMADRGEVTLAGHRLASLPAAARRILRGRKVGFVFQRANLLSGLSVLENILLAAAIAGLAQADGIRGAKELLRALGVEHLADRSPDGLSGGEEHRVAVARALVHRPDVVFADEPTGNLDGASGQAVAESLAHLSRAQSAAVLVATHDVRLRPFATRRIVMIDGTLSPLGG